MIKTSAERIPKTEEPRKHQTAAFPGIITIAVLQLHSPAMPEAIRRISLHSHPAALSFSCPDITCFLLSEPDPEDMFPAQNKRMNEYNGISATKIVQIYKHTFFKILLTG